MMIHIHANNLAVKNKTTPPPRRRAVPEDDECQFQETRRGIARGQISIQLLERKRTWTKKLMACQTQVHLYWTVQQRD